MTRNIRLSWIRIDPVMPRKKKEIKQKKWREIFSCLIRTDLVPTKERKKKIVTRNFLKVSFQKSDPACHYFLVTFYNYPARNIVDKKKRRKKEEISDEKFSAHPSEQTQSDQKTKNKKKTILWQEMFWLSFQKSDQDSLLFLVTFYNYPARSIVDKEKTKTKTKTKQWREIFGSLVSKQTDLSRQERKKRKQNKIVTRNFWLSYPSRPSHIKERKNKNNFVTRNVLTVIPEIRPR